MRIVVDMQGAQSTGNATRGIGRYSLAFAEALLRNCGPHDVWIALNGNFPQEAKQLRCEFAKKVTDSNIIDYSVLKGICGLDPANRSRQIASELIREAALASVLPDFVHVSSLFEGLIDDCTTSIGEFDASPRTSATLYDLIPMIFRDTYLANPQYELWYERKLGHLRRADLIFAISESAASEAVNLLGLSKEKTVNVSTAANSVFAPTKYSKDEEIAIRQRLQLNGKILLYTGGIEHRKNIERLIEAFSKSLSTLDDNFQLVIVCAIELQEKKRLQNLCSRLGMSRNRVLFTGFISEPDLLALYNLCDAFVFPSLHEGFGLPALEAMQCGAAVIASNTSSLPEVIGNREALFDPFSVNEMATKIVRVCRDAGFRKELKRKGIQQAKKFSWDITAKTAIAAYENRLAISQTSGSPAIRSRRPTLAMISPVPPDQSGIADYVAELVPELSKFYRITVFTQSTPCTDLAVIANADVLDVTEFPLRRRHFDRILYQFGNSAFHSHMFDMIAKYPGAIVLHDFYLSGPLADAEFKGDRSLPFTRSLSHSHGQNAVCEWQFSQDKGAVVLAYPANLGVLQSALGVMVHSNHAKDLADSWYGKIMSSDWHVMPLLKMLPVTVDRQAARKRLQIGANEFIVCNFGGLGPTKMNIEVIGAWFLTKACKGASRLIFAGRGGSSEYEQRMGKCIRQGPTTNVTITGTLDVETYRDYLQAADCAIQLRTMSRGETSASVLDCMAYGVPVIANANGAMAELPSDCLSLLPDGVGISAIAREIDHVWENGEIRGQMGNRARRYVQLGHNPKMVAELFFSNIESIYIGPEAIREELIDQLSKIETVGPDMIDWSLVSRTVKRNHPPKSYASGLGARTFGLRADSIATRLSRSWTPNQIIDNLKMKVKEHLFTQGILSETPRLFVDVTHTVKTNWSSGIQRVVRNIASEMTDTNFPAQKFQPILCFSDRQKFFIRATISTDKAISVNRWLGERITDFSAADRIFMLDSSWEFYRTQHKILRRAKLAGTLVFSCLYDMVPLRVPALCHSTAPAAYTPWFESALSISDGFVCISKAVADEFLALLKAIDFPRKMMVGYWPLGANIGKSAGILRPPRDPSRKLPNFLVVGTIEPRKNHLLILDAFGELWSQGYEGTLTLLGRRGWSCEHIVEAIERNPELGRKLNWVKDADDGELGAAYWSHDILIAPSHAEGFGLPIVEALQHGCQVLASDIPVFREVAGNSPSVQYFEPNSKLSLMGKIKTASAEAAADQAAVAPTRVNWEQSTAMLADVVVNDHWYTEYTPSTVESIPTESIGNTRMTRQLSRDDTRHRLELIGPAIFSQDGKFVKYAVKVSNDTAQFFSSRGLPDGSMGIFLGCHAVGKNGEAMDFSSPRSVIPFILPPNDSVYLAIEIELKKLPSRAAFIDIEMFQEGANWWGNPLRVPLDHC